MYNLLAGYSNTLYVCVDVCISVFICMYSRGHEKIAITVQRSPFERRSAFTVHGNDVHF